MLYIQSVLIQCFICKVSLLFSALYAKCPSTGWRCHSAAGLEFLLDLTVLGTNTVHPICWKQTHPFNPCSRYRLRAFYAELYYFTASLRQRGQPDQASGYVGSRVHPRLSRRLPRGAGPVAGARRHLCVCLGGAASHDAQNEIALRLYFVLVILARYLGLDNGV